MNKVTPHMARLRQADTSSQTDGLEVLPNFSGMDFITAPPGAFTDLAGGAQLRCTTPIDVIRVRIAGIDSYSDAHQTKIAQIATQIERLGLDTFVVAGASVQPVAIYVPEYWVEDESADLGWVEQEWTNLGAAVISETKVSSLNKAFALTVLGVVLLGWIIITPMQTNQERKHIHVLRRIGWRRGRIIWHLTGPKLPSVFLIAATGAVLLNRQGALPRSVLTTMIIVAVLAALTAVVLSYAGEYRRTKAKSQRQVRSANRIAYTHLRCPPHHNCGSILCNLYQRDG